MNQDIRRLMLCFQACEGIDTEDLEAGSVSIIEKLHDQAAKQTLAELRAVDEEAKLYVLRSDRLMKALRLIAAQTTEAEIFLIADSALRREERSDPFDRHS